MRKNAAVLALFCFSVFAALAFTACSGRKTGRLEGGAKTLIIYSPHPGELIDYIVKEFRQRTDIKAEVARGGTGELIEKIKRHPEAVDVLWGGGIESIETIKTEFAPYRSREDAAIIKSFKSADSLWSPFSVLPVVIMYNSKLVKGSDVPHSWASLLRPYYEHHIIMGNPSISGSSYTILNTLLRTMSSDASYTEGWRYVDHLVAQLGSSGIVSSSTAVYNSVASGDFFACITFENSALSLKKQGRDVDYCYPAEGTSAVPDGIAIIRNSLHPSEARQFVDFALSRDVQSILMSRWHRRSVRADIQSSEIDLSRIRIIDYPIEDSAKMRSAVLERWEKLLSSHQP